MFKILLVLVGLGALGLMFDNNTSDHERAMHRTQNCEIAFDQEMGTLAESASKPVVKADGSQIEVGSTVCTANGVTWVVGEGGAVTDMAEASMVKLADYIEIYDLREEVVQYKRTNL